MPGGFVRRTLIVCSLIVGRLSAAEAQSPTAPPKPSVTAVPASAPPQAAAQQPAAVNGTPALVVDLQAMDGIIGKSVKSAAGDDLGRLIDLLVGPNGQIRAAIIDFGGLLGLGSRKVAVDWHTLDFSDCAKGGAIKMSLTRDALRVSPEFRAGEPIVIMQSAKPEATLPPKPSAPTVTAAAPSLGKPAAAQPVSGPNTTAAPAAPVPVKPAPAPPSTAPAETK